jgi:hypothetical protein
MNQYQPYSMNNNYMPYQNGMYQQPQMYPQQMQNTQMDRLAQLQAMQQSLQPAQMQPAYQGLLGRVVDDFGAITANDVPMNGLGAVFIKKDGSEVQIRSWTANGTIATTSYMPVLEPNNAEANISTPSETELKFGELATLIGAVSEKVDSLSTRLDGFINKAKSKKESE